MPSKHRAWAGSAIIQIRHMRFEALLDVRELDLEHVGKLVRKYKTDPFGCEPFLPQNRVPVLVSRSNLRDVLSRNQLMPKDLHRSNPPKLVLSTEDLIICLHGRHRLAAAEACLEPSEQWWGVELYYEEGRRIFICFMFSSLTSCRSPGAATGPNSVHVPGRATVRSRHYLSKYLPPSRQRTKRASRVVVGKTE